MVNVHTQMKTAWAMIMQTATREKAMNQKGKRSLAGTWFMGLAWLLSILCISASSAVATVGGEIIWELADGQTGKQEATASVMDTSGNMILTGSSILAAGNEDFYTIKVSSSGAVLWRKSFDYAGADDRAVAVALDGNGDVIVAGFGVSAGNVNLLVIKYDGTTGDAAWTQPYVYDGDVHGSDYPTAIAVDSDDTIYVAGYSQVAPAMTDDFLVVKLDTAGTFIHELSYDAGIDGDDRVVAIVTGDDYPATPGDDFIIVTGYSWHDHGGRFDFDMTTIKYNFGGNEQWVETYDAGVGDDRGQYLALGPDNNVFVAGYSTSTDQKEIVVFKYDTAASRSGGPVPPLWQATVSDGDYNLPEAVTVGVDGDLYLAGATFTNSGMDDFFTARYDGDNGTLRWQQTFDGPGYEKKDIPVSIITDTHGGLFVTGYSEDGGSGNKDFLTIKYHQQSGNRIWYDLHDVGGGGTQQAVNVAVDLGLSSDGHVVVSGWSASENDDFSGTVSQDAADRKTVQDSTQTSWLENQWIGYYVVITSGLNVGQSRRIDSNTTTFLTVESSFESPTLAGDSYTIYDLHDYDYYLLKYDYGELNPPSQLTAQVISENEIDLSWLDNSALMNESGFCVERCSGIGCDTFTEIVCLTTPDQTSYQDTGLTPHVRYTYRLRSHKDQATYSAYSEPVSVLTTVFAPLAPGWVYRYNSPDNLADDVYGVGTGPDHHPVIVGSSVTTLGQNDYLTVKVDRSSAAEIWSHRYNDPDDDTDIATCVGIDDANGVLVSGYSSLYGGSGANTNDIFTLKFDASGPDPYNMNPPNYGAVWVDQYAGPGGSDDRSMAVDTANNAGLSVVVGYGKNSDDNDDIYVILYDENGTRLWAAVPFDGAGHGNDYPSDVLFDPSGDIIVGGTTFNGSDYDHFVRKYSASDGSVLWTAVYDSGYGHDEIDALTVDEFGNVYAVGYVTNEAYHLDMFIGKILAEGNSQWVELVGGDGADYDEAIAAHYDRSHSEIVVGGLITSETGSVDFHVRRYTLGGVLVWERTLDRDIADDYLVAMAVDASGTTCLAGETDNGANIDILAVCYDMDGNLSGSTIYNGSADRDDTAAAMAVNELGEMFVAGASKNSDGNTDYLLFKCETNTIVAPGELTATPRYTTVDLSWQDHAVGEDDYHIWRKEGRCSEGGAYQLIQVTQPETSSFADSGLSPGMEYCYRVQTFAGGITSEPVEVDTQTVAPPEPGCTATPTLTTEIHLSWTDSTVGEEGIDVLRCTGLDCTPTAPGDSIISLSPGSVSYEDSSSCELHTNANLPYTYAIRFYNSVENWETVSLCANIAPLEALPLEGFTAQAISEGEVVVSWSDLNTESMQYNIYRCQGSGCTPSSTPYATITATALQPVVDLRMNESVWSGAAGEVVDRSGNGNHGTALQAQSVAPGWIGGHSGFFDSGSDVVQWPYTNGWPVNSFTMAAWVKTNEEHEIDNQGTNGTPGTAGQHYLFGAQFREAPDAGAGISVGTNGISVYEHSGGYMPALAVYSGNLGSGWNHVAVTYTNKQIRIYLNGTLVRTGYTSNRTNVYAPFQAGSGAYGSFPGYIDEVKIYNYALSAAEVAELSGLDLYRDTNVLPGSSYTYRATSLKTALCSWESPGSEASATPLLNTPCPVTASPVNSTQVDVAWADTFGYESGYEIERCEGVHCLSSCTLGPSCNIAAVGANVTSYTASDACPGTEYWYQVRAYSNSGWESVCADSATTLAPTPPTGLTAERYSEQEIIVSWNDTNSEESGFAIERCEEGVDCPNFVKIATAPSGDGLLTYIDKGLSNNGLLVDHTYRYRVQGEKTGSCGWPTGYSNEDTATPTLIAPDGLTAHRLNSTQVALDWNNTTSWETGFALHRCVTGDGGCSLSAATSVIDSSLPPGSAEYIDSTACSGMGYQYLVEAVNDSWPTNPQTAPSSSVTTQLPVAPYGLEAEVVSESEMNLTWRDSNPDETGFVVERCDGNATFCGDNASRYADLQSIEVRTVLSPPTDFLHLYRMDENSWSGSSYDILDTGSGSIKGRSYSGANTVPAGVSKRAGNFDGANDYLMLENSITLSRTGSSLSWWMKPDTTIDTGLFTSTSYGSTVSIIESRGSSIYGETNNNCNYITFPGVTKNTNWTMYTLVFEDEHSYLYINGAYFGETPDYGYDNCSTTPANKLLADLTFRYIGQRTQYSQKYYDGQLDEIAVFNRALSADEVADRFQALSVKFQFNMEEELWTGAPGEVRDSGMLSHNGTVQGDTAVTSTGQHRGAAFFDGVGDAILLGDVDEMDAPSALSVSIWFNRLTDQAAATGHGIQNVLLSQASDGDNDNLEIGTEGTKVEVYLDSAAGSDPLKSVEAGIVNDTWYHLALTYDQRDANPLKLYLNGALLGAWNEFSGPLASSGGSPLTLGLARPGGSQFPGGDFNGFMDDVTVYGYALSAAEVTSLAHGFLYDNTLTQEQTYTYRVKAYKGADCGWESHSQLVTITTPLPPPPTDLTVVSAGATGVGLSWQDQSGSESAYLIYRCSGTSCSDHQVVATLPPNTEQYLDTLCTPGVYSYKVAAQVVGVPIMNDTGAKEAAPLSPAAPTNLSQTLLTEEDVQLDWIDNMSEEWGYKIARCVGVGCEPNSTDVIGEVGHTVVDDFSGGISAVTWNQGAGLETVGATTPPIDIADASGTARINESAARVEMIVSSTGAGSNQVYNSTRLTHVNPAVLGSGDFDVRVDYAMPDGDRNTTFVRSTVDLRLIIYLGSEYFYVERSHSNGQSRYRGVSNVNGSWNQSEAITSDTAGKLRLARVGRTLQCFVFTGGDWTLLHSWDMAAGVVPTALGLYQYAERSEAVSLRTYVDNVSLAMTDLSPTGESFGYVDQGLSPPGATFVYKVYPFSSACSWEGYAETVDVVPQVSCADDLHVDLVNTTEISLVWSDTTSSETLFEVERCDGNATLCQNNPQLFTTIGQSAVDAPTYMDQSGSPDREYTYRVKTLNSALGWSCFTNPVSVLTTTPVAPTGLVVNRGSEVRAELVWNDTTQDEDRFVLQRGDANCTNFNPLGETGGDDADFSDNQTVAFETTYCYQVQACKDDKDPNDGVDASWCTAFSNQETVYTAIDAPEPLLAQAVHTTRVDLSWTDRTESETGFIVERCAGEGCTDFTPLPNSPTLADATSFSDTTACPNTVYRYQVTAVRSGLWSSAPTIAAGAQTAMPLPVSGLSATETVDGADERAVEVRWSDGNLDEEGFLVERCAGVNCSDYESVGSMGSAEDIAKEINPAFWNVWGGLETVSSTTPPIDLSDASGVAQINKIDNGVELLVSSTGSGTGWNSASLFMAQPGDLGAGDFDLQIDYTLPDDPVVPTVNQFYLKLSLYFPDPDGAGPLLGDYFFIQRMVTPTTGKYKAGMQVGNVTDAGSLETADTSGKLRITKEDDVLRGYAWTGGVWVQIGPTSAKIEHDLLPAKVDFGTITNNTGVVDLRTHVSDFRATQIFTDIAVSPSSHYCYRVSPTKSATCAWDPIQENLYAEVCQTAAPAAPTSFAATASGMLMNLSWHDESSDEDGFIVEKRLFHGGYVAIATTGPDVESIPDNRGIEPNSRYEYRLRAYRGSLQSAAVTAEDVTGSWEEPMCVEQ